MNFFLNVTLRLSASGCDECVLVELIDKLIFPLELVIEDLQFCFQPRVLIENVVPVVLEHHVLVV